MPRDHDRGQSTGVTPAKGSDASEPSAVQVLPATGYTNSTRHSSRICGRAPQRKPRWEVSRMLEKLAHWTESFARLEELGSEEGQALVEYGLILALVAVVCIVALQLLGQNVAAQITAIATAIGGA